MTLEDPEARTRETLAAGLVKGQTACNRSACQTPLTIGSRWFNTSTRAFYCSYCAKRINSNNYGNPICVQEEDLNNPPPTMFPLPQLDSIYGKK